MSNFNPQPNLYQPLDTGERLASPAIKGGELNLSGVTQGQSWADLQNRLHAGLFTDSALPPGMALEIVAPEVNGSAPPPGYYGQNRTPSYYGSTPVGFPMQHVTAPLEPSATYITGPRYSNGGTPHLTVPSWAGTAPGTYPEGATPAQAAAWNRVNQMAMRVYLSAPSLVDQNGPIAASGFGYPYNPNTIHGVGDAADSGPGGENPRYSGVETNIAGLRPGSGSGP